MAKKIVIRQSLNHRETLFIQHYLTAKTATEAARLAGYTCNPGSQASRLMRRTRIQETIRQARDALAKRNGIDQNKIVELLLLSYDEARNKNDAMGMLRSAKEIAELCGLYPD